LKIACQEGLAPGKTFAERLENLARYGFDGVELRGDQLLERAGIEERKAALKDSPVKPSSICGGISSHFINTDPERRRQAIESAKRMLDAAAELGAVGPIGVPIFRGEGSMPDLSPFMTRQQLRDGMMVEVFAEVGEYANAAGSVFLLEPLNRYEAEALNRIEQAAQIIQQIAGARAAGGGGIMVMADFFHMDIEEANAAAAIEKVGGLIGHCHLADNQRKEPGSGDLDFTRNFRALKKIGFTGYMAFECGLTGPAEEALPRSVRFLRECLSQA
jgi:sugar phosphate isomerase/epimerase